MSRLDDPNTLFASFPHLRARNLRVTTPALEQPRRKADASTGLVWNSFEAHGAPIVCLADFGFRGVRDFDPPLFSRFAMEEGCLVLPCGDVGR